MHLKCLCFLRPWISRLLSEWLKELLSQNPRRWDQHVLQYLNILGFLNTGTSLCCHIVSSILVSTEDSSYFILSLFTGMYPKSNSFIVDQVSQQWNQVLQHYRVLDLLLNSLEFLHTCSWRTEVNTFYCCSCTSTMFTLINEFLHTCVAGALSHTFFIVDPILQQWSYWYFFIIHLNCSTPV